jgi:uroporphyrinogen-III synthase
MRNRDLRGARVLLPRAAGGGAELISGLEELGANVIEVVLYEARPPTEPDVEALAFVRDGRVDIATFASSSSVQNLASLLGGDLSCLKEATIACIGPVTAATAREVGLEVHIEPPEHTIAALVEALKSHFAHE